MPTFSDIEIKFNFSRGDEVYSKTTEFDPCDSALESSTIDDYKEELLSKLNDSLGGGEEDWEFDEFEVTCFDGDWTNPKEFLHNLDEYGAYAENVEKHGEAFHLRYEDLCDLDDRQFNDSFEGTWKSEEDYAKNWAEETGVFDDSVWCYIDWESYARDLLMDLSTYEGADGIHIFRN